VRLEGVWMVCGECVCVCGCCRISVCTMFVYVKSVCLLLCV